MSCSTNQLRDLALVERLHHRGHQAVLLVRGDAAGGFVHDHQLRHAAPAPSPRRAACAGPRAATRRDRRRARACRRVRALRRLPCRRRCVASGRQQRHAPGAADRPPASGTRAPCARVNSCGSWNERPTPRRVISRGSFCVMSWPSKNTLPLSGLRKPVQMLMKVVLPAPFCADHREALAWRQVEVDRRRRRPRRRSAGSASRCGRAARPSAFSSERLRLRSCRAFGRPGGGAPPQQQAGDAGGRREEHDDQRDARAPAARCRSGRPPRRAS